MFNNLQAEQARRHMTNQQVADEIGISRTTYESKKRTGCFTVRECAALCKIFSSSFEYLFDTDDNKSA